MIWRGEPSEWRPFPSPADGISNPSLEIVRGGAGPLGLVVSEWRNGNCLRAHAVRFDRPVAYCAVDETIYSIGSIDPKRDYSAYLQIANLSDSLEVLGETVNMLANKEIRLKQYLAVGLNDCLEIISKEPPKVSAASSYQDARAIALGERAE